MVGSHKKKFIFFQNEKVAGTSISNSIMKYNNFHRKTHHKPSDFILEGKKSASIFEEYFTFAFVRNPYDWFISHYEYLRQNPSLAIYNVVKDMDFIDFVNWKCVNDNRTQYSFLSNGNDNESDININFIGRYETLNEDFETIMNTLEIQEELPWLNKNTRQEMDEYITDEIKDVIYEYFKKDFDFFGYIK